jgi:hypothetical protein
MSTNARIAAGAFVLSTGLLLGSGGGAIAIADTPSPSPGQSADGAGSPSSSGSPAAGIGTIADSLRKAAQNSWQATVQGVTGTLASLPKPGGIASGIPSSPKTTFGGTPTVHGSTGPDGTTATDPAAQPVAATPPVVDTVATTPSSTETAPVANTPVTAPATPATVTAGATQSSPSANDALSAASLAASNAAANAASAAANATSNVLASASNTFATVSGAVAALPGSAPVTEAIAQVQNVITAVANAGASLSQLPSELSELLGASATVPTAVTGTTTGGHPVISAKSLADMVPAASPLPSILALPGVQSVPAPNATSTPVTLLDFATPQVDAGATTAAPAAAPIPSGTHDILSIVEHVIGAFVASVSLTALLAVALPGIGGLLATCAAGIRVGYRQAKAGAELPGTAISRFVGSGPVGVVRSGSQVSLRGRTASAKRPDVRPARTRTLRAVEAAPAEADLLDAAV